MMKNLFILTSMLLAFGFTSAQTAFNDDMDVISYMNGKSFYNAENGLTIQYGSIPSINTYGITITNKNGARFYFINVDISTYGSFADLYGMSPENGRDFGFRLYKSKLIVGKGEEGEQTYYLK